MRQILTIFILIFSQGFSQTIYSNHFGASVGLILNFGTQVNSIGASIKTYYSDYFYQVNLGSSLTWNLKSYGERRKFWENRNYVGLFLLGGKKDNTFDFQLDGLTHQTKFRNGVGYNYLWYFDNAGTSQLSGGWSLHLNKLGVYFENDVFGGQANDRFRTGHLLFSYRFNSYKFGTGLYLWTGETDGSIWERIISDKCPNGFKKLNDLPYGKTSHGILYGSLVYDLSYGQTANFKVGIDSEHIRHSIQNRLIHDLIFLPKKIKRNTPHYPCLDEEGLPVFDKNKIRKNKFYLQMGMNENWSN